MTRLIYSILLYLLLPLVVLYLCFRCIKSSAYRQRWRERFGFKTLQRTDVVFHCVSMGETLAAVPLIKQLMKQHPQLNFTITTTSPTGSEQVIKAFGDSVQHCYLPFDFSYAMQRFIAQLQPKICVIMETELWPNLVHVAHANGTQLVLANARLSAKSARKYQQKPQLSIPMLKQLHSIVVQTPVEAQRFIDLGVEKQRVTVSGSVKFDISIDSQLSLQAQTLRQQWHKHSSPVWVAGSVHPGEFDIMLQAHKAVLAEHPQALLVVAPRHPEQFEHAADVIVQSGLSLARRSKNDSVTSNTQVLLGDTMGELLKIYGAADQAFIGGTLIENGGHNPLEPAAMGLPVFVGPNHWDFAEITHLLNQAGGLHVVTNADELAAGLLGHFNDKHKMKTAAAAAMAVVEQNKGALAVHFNHISPLIAQSSV